ncbi:MAG: S8 family serine peptidase [candidate division Zixibacteria bacterium]
MVFIFLIIGITVNANADAPHKTLPDGGTCFADRFVVTVEPNTPPLEINSTRNGFASTGISSIDDLCAANKVVKVEKWYPYPVIHEETKKFVDKMYIFFVAEDVDVTAAAENFKANLFIEFSDLYRIPVPVRVPNDPNRGSQWFLNRVDAYQAWDIIWGTETEYSIIAIVDTGVYWTHPDLNPNIWSGIGEDMSNMDGNPTEPYPIHGTHVAGCASEATNNGLGGAGLGWSSKIMAVKGADNNGNLYYVWQGITWAADHGAHIINCSWGGVGYSGSEQNIINHVWSVHDVLVVASAGNDDYWTPPYTHYPSAYSHVLAVASTNSGDHKPAWSNYGTWVDVSAPGEGIFSTWGANTYGTLSGTSMSSPIVAGLAGLIRAGNHSLSANETSALIVNGAEPISDYYYNQGWMGSGRINAYNSVLDLGGVDPPAPTAPPDNSYSSESYPVFTWTEIPEATVYHIQIDDGDMFISPILDDETITENTYTSPISLPDDMWNWRVRAGNGSEWSDWSEMWSFGVDTTPPDAPTNLTVTPDGWTNEPEYSFSWVDPPDVSGISSRFYKVGSPPEHDFDYEGTFARSPQTYTTSDFGQQTLYLWCMDYLELVDYQNNSSVDFYYDGLPPYGCIASSPSYSSSETFNVSWTFGEDDESGISGIYDLRYKEDDGVWADWLVGSGDLSAAFTGTIGHTYYFEARTSDNAGNYEQFTGTPESSTVIGEGGAPCGYYVVGDYNGNLSLNVADIISGFSKLITGSPEPALSCECPGGSGNFWAVAMDVNNSCAFNVADIISAFSKLKTGSPELTPCEVCPPDTPPIPPGGDIPLFAPKTISGSE